VMASAIDASEMNDGVDASGEFVEARPVVPGGQDDVVSSCGAESCSSVPAKKSGCSCQQEFHRSP